MIPALLPIVAAGGGGTPLDYGDDLVMFLDAENGVTESSNNVSQWTDQGDDAFDFDRPGGDDSPQFESSSQNGLPGINFESFGSSDLARRLNNADSGLDNLFGGAGDKTLAFAARADALVDPVFSAEGALAEKGFRNENGWLLLMKSDGSLEFRHKRSDGTFWQISAGGFYSAGDLVLGTLTYNGGNLSGSGSFRLWNGSTFVTTGTVTTGTSSTRGNDGPEDFVVGNQEGSGSGFNAPFQGPVFAMWATKPAISTFDEGYMARWVV